MSLAVFLWNISIWLAFLGISDFAKVRKKRCIEITCKLQVIYERRKVQPQCQGWERIIRKGVGWLSLLCDRKGENR